MKALLFLIFTINASQAADPYWYGTITFNKTLKTQETTTYPAGTPYYPGVKIDTVEKTWSGTVRFLPNKKVNMSARYVGSTISKRNTSRMQPCPWRDSPTEYRDNELVETKSNFTTNREVSGDFYMRIQDDGTYKKDTSATGGIHQQDVTQIHSRREFYNTCSTPHLQVNDQKASESDGMDPVDFVVKGIADPNAQTISGHWSGKDSDGGDLEYSWDLSLSEPKLIARITGPTTIERARAITLDASASEGNIKEYTWEFVPNDGCMMTHTGSTIKLKGKKVSFTALCDFTAYLDVEDESEIETAKILINVTPRKGDSWLTKFKTKAGPNFTARIISNGIPLGINQCTLHPGNSDETGHFIHTDDLKAKTWKDSGYKMLQVTDTGPFQGSWYIDTQSLKIDRMERVNTNILPGGEIYQLNASHNNLSDIQALGAQIKAHEKMHSTLIQEELTLLGPDHDPAVQIEKLVFPDDELLQNQADFEVRTVESFIYEATSDIKVKDRLHSTGSFNKSVKIWVPLADDDNDPTNNPDFLKDMGALWSIGDN